VQAIKLGQHYRLDNSETLFRPAFKILIGFFF
jgi:hypothetical protein